MALEAALEAALEEDWMEASAEAVVLTLEVVAISAALVVVAEEEAVVLDRVVLEATNLDAAWAGVLEEAQAQIWAPAAAMAPAVTLEDVALEEVLVRALEVSEGATAVGSAIVSNNNLASSPSYGKLNLASCP